MKQITIGPQLQFVLFSLLFFFSSILLDGSELHAQTINANYTNPTCENSADGSITITVSGGTSPYTYSWTGTGVSTSAQNQSNLTQGTYSVEVTDSSDPAKSTTETFTLTAEDNENPTITAPGAIEANTVANDCNASNVTLGTPTTDDNCGVATVTNDAPSDFPLGETIVTWTVTDDSGNTATDTQKVTISDNTNPTITAPADIETNTDTNDCNASSVNLGNETTSDNCGVASVINDAPSDFPLGETIVTWTVTDDSGNTATDTQKVTIRDNTNPMITAPADIETNTDTNDCNASSVNLGNETTSDNCGVASVINDAPSDFPLGETIVTWTVTDDSGNTATDTQKVTISDNTNPTITAPADIETNTDTNDCNASSVNLGNETTSDNCGVASVINDAPSDFPLGETIVTWTVTDDSGNTATDTQKVTISDNTKPVIISGDDVEATNNTGLCEVGLSIAPAIATDNCNVSSPIGTRDDGLGLDEPYPVGKTLISWNVQDANGNSGEEVIQAVIVEDNEAPAIPELEDIIWGCEYTVEAPVTTDNCSGEIVGTTSDPVTYSNAGTYTINWKFTDENGNISQANQDIKIQPIEADVVKVDVLCNGFATGEVEAIATGGVAPLSYDWGSLGTGAKKTDLPAGTYTVTVSDANGCEAEPITVIVEEPDTFIEITDATTTSGCLGEDNGTATVSAIGGTGDYTYLWEDGQTTQKATGLEPGNHTVTITDENGCSKDRTVTVSQPTELIITGFLTTETTSFGSATGTATAQISGGTPSYNILWSNGATGQTASNLAAGMYTVTVTDLNGCVTTAEVEVVDTLYANIIPLSICQGEDIIRTSTFSIENGTAIGGTAPYIYSWDFGENATPAIGSGIGPIDVKYGSIGDKLIKLTVTDAKGRKFEQRLIQYVGGCFADDCGSNDLGLDNFFIGDNFKNKITSDNCSSTDEKFIYITFPTNATRYSLQIELIYSIENLETGNIENFKVKNCFFQQQAIPDIAKTFPIQYNCGDIVKVEGIFLTFQNNISRECGTTATNGNGNGGGGNGNGGGGNGNGGGNDGANNPKCFSTNNEATVTSPLFGVAFPNELLCNGSNNGNINARASGGIGSYTFTLISTLDNSIVRGPQVSNQFNELPGGKYRVIIEDSEQTFTTNEIEILQPSNPLSASTSQTDVSCFGKADGSGTVSASGGTPNNTGDPYIYVWNNGQTGQTASNLAAGEYEVRVIDANGCEIFATVTIEQPAELIANAGPDQVLGCGFNSSQLEAEENLDENENAVPGEWTIVNGPTGGSFVDATDPKTIFTGNQGTYTLRWSIDCGKSDDVKITYTNCSTLDFDGVDDHVNFGDNYGLSSSTFTVEAWIKPHSNDGIKTIMSKKDIGNPSGGFELIMNNGVPSFNGLVTAENDEKIESDRWYHIAVSHDGATLKLYVDGILIESTEVNTNPEVTTSPFLLGAIYDSTDPNNPKNLFHGWIEEVRIWSKALSTDNLRLLMNQRLKLESTPIRGEILPINASDISWADLQGYYQLLPSEISTGVTFDKAANKVNGKLVNILTTQKNTAPLPYISAKNGDWREKTTWREPTVWDWPNNIGINKDSIKWNIAKISHTLKSGRKKITVLGLISESGTSSKLNMEGSIADQSGNELHISHYLKLNGVIDLNGESQLVQPLGSILEPSSSGYLDRDQQGVANSFNYNYWTSPVSNEGASNNFGFKLNQILFDGTNPNASNQEKIKFIDNNYRAADYSYTGTKKISTYWLYTFRGTADDYSQWIALEKDELLKPGFGYSMKGTSGDADLSIMQNYTFRGKPNNGNISVKIGPDQNLLTGNPYPSAIDSEKFIKDNAIDSQNFNGSLYFWDHFGKIDSHYLEEYVGGYAILNLSGSTEAASSIDSRINTDTDLVGSKEPGRYIPVGQGFFISTTLISNPDSIRFNNSQRIFVKEESEVSVFHSQEEDPKKAAENEYEKDTRHKIRLKLESPKGYHRQILATADVNTTDGFDLGYDAPLIENNVEDLYWMIDESEFVIQGVPDFNKARVLPIGFKIAEAGEYTIKIDELENIQNDIDIYLLDTTTEEYHDLMKSDYTMSTDSVGIFNEKYQIVFQKLEDEVSEEVVQGKPEVEEESDPDFLDMRYLRQTDEIALYNPDLQNIDFVELYSVSGQKIMTFSEIPMEESISLRIQQKLSSAVYVVKIYVGEKSYSKKVIITK